MDNKPAVDYQKVIADFSAKKNIGENEPVALPDQAGVPVVDYEAVSKKWKDADAKMLRVDREDGK